MAQEISLANYDFWDWISQRARLCTCDRDICIQGPVIRTGSYKKRRKSAAAISSDSSPPPAPAGTAASAALAAASHSAAGGSGGGGDTEGAAGRAGVLLVNDWLSLQAVTMRLAWQECWVLSCCGRADASRTHTHQRAHSHDVAARALLAARRTTRRLCGPCLPHGGRTCTHAGPRFGHARGRLGRAVAGDSDG
jgi:hypothetical protein